MPTSTILRRMQDKDDRIARETAKWSAQQIELWQGLLLEAISTGYPDVAYVYATLLAHGRTK